MSHLGHRARIDDGSSCLFAPQYSYHLCHSRWRRSERGGALRYIAELGGSYSSQQQLRGGSLLLLLRSNKLLLRIGRVACSSRILITILRKQWPALLVWTTITTRRTPPSSTAAAIITSITPLANNGTSALPRRHRHSHNAGRHNTHPSHDADDNDDDTAQRLFLLRYVIPSCLVFSDTDDDNSNIQQFGSHGPGPGRVRTRLRRHEQSLSGTRPAGTGESGGGMHD